MIIAFGHKARHGKDTAGEAVVDFYNRRRESAKLHLAIDWRVASNFEAMYPEARIFKFADELYRVCREEYGMTEKDPALLQRIGDGRRQEFGHNYWINRLATSLASFSGVAIVTDVRYTNEANYIKNLGGWTVNVSRLNTGGTPYVSPDRDPNFISEVQLDDYNYDYYIKAKTGDSALVAEQAVTLAEYVRGLEKE